MPILLLLGAGSGASPCIVVFIRQSDTDRCQRVSQQSSNADRGRYYTSPRDNGDLTDLTP